IAVGLYHTERDNIDDRLRAGVALALGLGRDVPVFWGLGDHGGGATREDLGRIDAFMTREARVRIIHSTPDVFFEAVRGAARSAPVFEGELGRTFTGCYTSLSRLKRRAVRSLGGLVQSEAIGSAAWWLRGHAFPTQALGEAWRLHLFNDFHDIISGSAVEPAEADALGQYGRAEDLARGEKLEAVKALDPGGGASLPLPVTVANANPAPGPAPVELECMADYRPFWTGEWHLRLYRADGSEVLSQEEQPEALLPFNGWRRRLAFVDDLPGVGISRYEVRALEGPAPAKRERAPTKRGHVPDVHAAVFRIGRASGLVDSLKARDGREFLGGPLFEPIVIEDAADSWGTERWSFRRVAGRFKAEGRPRVVRDGPVRTVTRTVLSFKKSRIIMDVLSYAAWPVLEFRLRITWNEDRRRLKLRVPTAFEAASVLCEVPGAAVGRPADGEEYVHGRWLVVEGRLKRRAASLGLVNSGQPGFDLKDGEVRLSVLRSAAYCHERGFDLGGPGGPWKFSDVGVHDVRLLVAVGEPEKVRAALPGLADHLSAPPAVYAHLPFGMPAAASVTLLSLAPAGVRLLACKPSWDGQALVVRLHEATGNRTRARLTVTVPGAARTRDGNAETGQGPDVESGHVPRVHAHVLLKPFEIRTVRVERDGTWHTVRMIEETPL
ncbi:MAG TPA: glycoside hydrolase family 38 C-terminal domain-containing protein, partial [Burkholderiales bacterium]|nr:glycoside hydrolase family 38 C-terminal domain-containing protein [Burkholderiales bacterium]